MEFSSCSLCAAAEGAMKHYCFSRARSRTNVARRRSETDGVEMESPFH